MFKITKLFGLEVLKLQVNITISEKIKGGTYWHFRKLFAWQLLSKRTASKYCHKK